MRYLMRSNATHGSASFANIPGYYVGGKTGTADKIIHGHYSDNKVFTTFMAIIRRQTSRSTSIWRSTTIRRPRLGDYGYHTAAWNAGRTTGALIRRIEPLEGVPA